MIRGVPAVHSHVDAAAERQGVVDDDDLLMVRRAHRMGAVDLEPKALIGQPVGHEDGSHTAADCGERADVPFEYEDFEVGFLADEPAEEHSQPVGAVESLLAWFEFDARVEVPADQHDSLLSLQHCGLRMMKVVSGVDDAGKIVRRFDAPAGFARNKDSVHSPIPRYAVSSRAAAWPARLAPIVDDDGPYPTRCTRGSASTCVARRPVIGIPPPGPRRCNGAR